MLPKWTARIVSLATVAGLTVVLPLSQAQFSAEGKSPTHQLMEQVQAKNLVITRGVRTPVAFQQARVEVVTAATEMANLLKQAREQKGPSEGHGKPYAEWTRLMDASIREAEAFAKFAAANPQATVKKQFNEVKGSCTACHNVFRVEDDDF